jgi:hypothetical protein
MTSRVDTLYVQSNILITQDDQACLGDFAIAGVFEALLYKKNELKTVRYIAPEHSPGRIINRSKEGDVFSIAMTSFEVCSLLWTVRFLIQSPCSTQVLTGILPYDYSERNKRPSRPTDPSQNQRLNDRIWNTITTCWSDKPERRCELSVVHYVFSTPSLQDALVESPPAGRKNIIRLREELSYTLILPMDPSQRVILKEVQKYISYAILGDATLPRSLPSTDAAALMRAIHKVSFPH